jgi:hypothetical protein
VSWSTIRRPLISEVPLDVASFLKEISEVLTQRGISSRELDGLDFEADGRDVSVRIRREPHGRLYPPLAAILGKIGRTLPRTGSCRSAALPHRFPSQRDHGRAGRRRRPAQALSLSDRRRAGSGETRTDSGACRSKQPRQFAGRSKASVTSTGCPIGRNADSRSDGPARRLCAAAHSRLATSHRPRLHPGSFTIRRPFHLQVVVWHDRKPALSGCRHIAATA